MILGMSRALIICWTNGNITDAAFLIQPQTGSNKTQRQGFGRWSTRWDEAIPAFQTLILWTPTPPSSRENNSPMLKCEANVTRATADAPANGVARREVYNLGVGGVGGLLDLKSETRNPECTLRENTRKKIKTSSARPEEEKYPPSNFSSVTFTMRREQITRPSPNTPLTAPNTRYQPDKHFILFYFLFIYFYIYTKKKRNFRYMVHLQIWLYRKSREITLP